MIRLDGFTFSYGNAVEPALRDINLKIADGEFVLVTGPSGGGKSTLCRCLNGLVPHFYGGRVQGHIAVQGIDVLTHPPRALATCVGMIFQDPENQIVATDVEREIVFGMENLAFPAMRMARRLEEALDSLGIAALRHRPIRELSGGEKQKVAIASVLALHPDVLVLDEPTSELDPRAAEEVLSVITRLNDELGLTVVLVEHRLDRVVHCADRVLVMADGNLQADGTPNEILSNGVTERCGIGIPPVVKLVKKLGEKGKPAEKLPLTVKEGRRVIGQILKTASYSPSDRQCAAYGEPVLEIENLWFRYPDGALAVKDVSLKVSRGEFVAVMGRNASGKTTLVKHLAGLLKPSKGTVTVMGRDTGKVTVAELAKLTGYVFQNPNDHLFADTVEGEITLTLKASGIAGEELKQRTDSILTRFRLQEYRKQYPRYLSGGERQRLALASVLVKQPELLILDEPTRGMDYGLKSELMQFLSQYCREGHTVLMVTHDVETVAEFADRVVLMSEGSVIVDGATRQALSGALLFSPQINRLVQSFAQYGIPQDILTVDELLELLS